MEPTERGGQEAGGRTVDYDYALPGELVAQAPAVERDASRLLVWHRRENRHEHRRFVEIPELLPSPAVLVVNDSRVIPARLRGRNPGTGGAFELLLLGEVGPNDWWAMVRPGRRAPIGRTIQLVGPGGADSPVTATVTETNDEGHRRLRFDGTNNLLADLESLGEMPLPPYITRPAGSRDPQDRRRYQTVYAGAPGSVAAPTAGLHFTEALLGRVRARGIRIAPVTLHVGAGTFAPVKAERLVDHRMHSEPYWVGAATADAINEARTAGHPVIAVGTTSLRVLESLPRDPAGRVRAGSGSTSIFLHPPARFEVVNGLITNFHLPQSTLLMLVSAFATPGELHGRELVLRLYAEAVRERYRFFSYGDAMFIQ
ncbi:MAG TPA: tRNA preQ1(34) S-adenosylmethionine ribosyltransferase-isomerase QueA [Verrucomicrobiales bacterium]|nr:tRNA preQ1(34) S-adenosylmethionine ribosyltransferase-isomerase QueA [Verrucomicrobiales bacterium]